MNAQKIFLSTFIIILVISILRYLTGSANIIEDIVGGLLSFLIVVALSVIISGLQVLGSGLNPASIRILFGLGMLICLLFQIKIGPLPLGFGLANKLIEVFLPVTNPFSLFGFLFSLCLVATAVISALIIIIGRGE